MNDYDDYQEQQDFDAEQESIANANAQGEAEAQAMNEQMETESELSHTCCNIEVSEPKETLVMCSECKEWCSTKGGE